jgi:hypothetical protein
MSGAATRDLGWRLRCVPGRVESPLLRGRVAAPAADPTDIARTDHDL